MENTGGTESYSQAFEKAVYKSDKWGCSGVEDFDLEIPKNIKLIGYINAVDLYILRNEFHENIHKMCGPVHFNLWYFLRSIGLPTTITIGDIAWRGQRVFNTSYATLKKEWRGNNYCLDKKFDAHVWLTLPDGETIIDVTALPFIIRENCADSRWNDIIYVSGAINMDEPLEHIPYLVGVNFLFQAGFALPL